MKTTLTLNVTTPELKAAARYQDNIQETIGAIMRAFGKEVPDMEPSNLTKLKLALGGSLSDNGENNSNGVYVSWSYTANKRDGVSLTFSMDAKPAIVTEVFNMYIDIIGYYAPVVTSSIAGITAAAALAEKRGTLMLKNLGKL